MRFTLLVAILIAAILVACGGGSTDDGSTSGGIDAGPTTAAASSSAGTSGGSISSAPSAASFSGTVNGDMKVAGVTCQPASSTNVVVSMSGTVGSAQYTFDINVGAPGTFDLAAGTPQVVLLSQTSPFQRWEAGSASSGSGKLTAEARSGTFVGDLVAIQGASGKIHVELKWTCP